MKLCTILILFTFLMAGTLEAYEEKDCSGLNHPAHMDEYRACVRGNIAIAATEAGVDCVTCLFEEKSKGPSALVQGLSALAQPVAYLLGQYSIAKFQNQTQEAWAKAYSSAYTECTNRFNSYLSYNTSVGANAIGTSDAATLMNSCNGNGYGSYAGYGGLMGNSFGGYGNPFLANGYSSGFLSGMGGMYPYATNSMYNNGMTSAGIGIGAYGTIGASTSLYQSGVTAAFGF